MMKCLKYANLAASIVNIATIIATRKTENKKGLLKKFKLYTDTVIKELESNSPNWPYLNKLGYKTKLYIVENSKDLKFPNGGIVSGEPGKPVVTYNGPETILNYEQQKQLKEGLTKGPDKTPKHHIVIKCEESHVGIDSKEAINRLQKNLAQIGVDSKDMRF